MGGDVALNGAVATYPQYLPAESAAHRADGVSKVHNHPEVLLYDGDYRDDAAVTTAPNNALALAVTVPDGVEAQAKDGNVTLTGTVTSGTQRSAAAAAVAWLYGVRNGKTTLTCGPRSIRAMSSDRYKVRSTATR